MQIVDGRLVSFFHPLIAQRTIKYTTGEPDAPTIGAKKVWWLVNETWVPKGWLMPEIKGITPRR